MVSHELRGLITATDLCNELLRMQELIKMCAEQVFASPALDSETIRERVGLLLNAYLDEAPGLQVDLQLTLEQMQREIQQASRDSANFRG